MSIFEPLEIPWPGRMLSILRIVGAFVYISVGTMKLFGFPVAYFQSHLPVSFWPTTNLGIPAILYCFIYLYFVFAGAGPWSIDAVIARKKGGNRY